MKCCVLLLFMYVIAWFKHYCANQSSILWMFKKYYQYFGLYSNKIAKILKYLGKTWLFDTEHVSLRCLEKKLETSLTVPLMMVMVTRQLASQLERAPDHENWVISRQIACVALFWPFYFCSATEYIIVLHRHSIAELIYVFACGPLWTALL